MSVIDGRQLKAGRIILGISIREMATAAGIHRNSVIRTESQKTLAARSYAADRIRETLSKRGILFFTQDGYAGVQFKTTRS